jgi:fatty acid desaturase
MANTTSSRQVEKEKRRAERITLEQARAKAYRKRRRVNRIKNAPAALVALLGIGFVGAFTLCAIGAVVAFWLSVILLFLDLIGVLNVVPWF